MKLPFYTTIKGMNGRGERDFWNDRKAEWYRKGLKFSQFPEKVLSFILPRTEGAVTYLDVGAGCGTLTIPLAERGKMVTAVDPSPGMMRILREELKKRGLTNVRCIEAPWGEVEIEPHDVIICANVPQLLKGSPDFVKDADRLARKAVFLIEGVDPEADRFYYKELYPLLFNKPYPRRTDYIATYNTLHSLKIYANVEIIEYNFDQPFDDIEEALEFWKEYIPLTTDEFDETLRAFLKRRLERSEEGLIARFLKRAAIMWWRKDQDSTSSATTGYSPRTSSPWGASSINSVRSEPA